ncbi:MAG: HAMP domain-containing sensor histidine kinase [Rickettsiaceae bacterium]|nr:HAMP domain-containing sensor histidine kinase [Rickettsiaceae bacterium]
MHIEQPKKQLAASDYNFNLKVIIILIAIEVIILVCMSFVKMYIDRKHSTLDRMRDEVQILEKIFLDEIEYSSYVMNQMADLIRINYQSPTRIESILSHYSLNINDKNFFGWRGFYWLDKKGVVKNTNQDCQIPIGTGLSHLSNVRLSKINPGRVFFCQNPLIKRDYTPYLDLALGVTNAEDEYIGTLFLELETSTILEDIEMYRRNNLTEFLILDNRMNVITVYPMNASRLTKDGKTISSESLLQQFKHINFFSDKQKEISDIQVFNGSNFLARKIKKKPYLLVVSLDPVYIKSTYTKKVAIKFIEISVLAVSFLAIIAIIYKRETWLRAKAERASTMATKAMVAKSDFLSYTAHEIRSPLGFILTGSEMMKKKLFGPISEQYEEYVSGIYHNAKLILDFINDILDEKNVANGNFRLIEEVCDLEAIIKIAAKTNQTRFHSRKINVELKICEDLPFILGDKRKLLQTMNNIISNSYKYSLDNTTITIEAKRSGKRIKIIVRDQGIGMTNEEMKIALTKYGTVHNNRSDNFIESYGLGLPIVAILTKAHDATLHIDSEIGIGTEITIILPERRIIEKMHNNSIA